MQSIKDVLNKTPYFKRTIFNRIFTGLCGSIALSGLQNISKNLVPKFSLSISVYVAL